MELATSLASNSPLFTLEVCSVSVVPEWLQVGCKLVPSKRPILKKLYFNLATDSRNSFRDYHSNCWTRTWVLVQYVSDDTLVEEFPHQNSKSNEKPYVKVCPSVISNIKSSDPSESPSQVYNKQIRVDNPSQLDAILKPTDV